MSKMRNTTKGILLGVTILLIAWDIVAVIIGGGHATESNVLLTLATKHYTIPYGWGVLGGHFFWPRKLALFGMDSRDSLFKVILPSTAVLAFADIFVTAPGWALPFFSAIGYFVGHFFWPQYLEK